MQAAGLTQPPRGSVVSPQLITVMAALTWECNLRGTTASLNTHTDGHHSATLQEDTVQVQLKACGAHRMALAARVLENWRAWGPHSVRWAASAHWDPEAWC